MSKLSPGLKSLINARHARPGPAPTNPHVTATYAAIARSAASHGVGLPAWLTITAAATVTLNSPASLLALHRLASNTTATTTTTTNTPNSTSTATIATTTMTTTTSSKVATGTAITTAELIRTTALKCISFNGIPRTINCLNAFYAALPSEISSRLSTTPTRRLTVSNLQSRLQAGRRLWSSVYWPLDEKLTQKLARSHPDLPDVILEAHYGVLLSDPDADSGPDSDGVGDGSKDSSRGSHSGRLGRVLTSLVGIACLRAQTGVGPQVLSHVFGLRKAFEDGSAVAETEEVVEGGEWLASDEGGVWILECVDSIVRALGEGQGNGEMGFAPPWPGGGLKAKL